ncbi:hypothetical protein M2271_001261 [Streptomyces sp. LBL]|uniref:hypothetical protein n=1 Tax=Streptomyces sp. LBL TaxID=2940562 RepID=UPI0024744753|nr:hypothetical protein [Streptomyces sp. LBL]MDH6623474.1 hypothetical protein [Streptomyces sp. LBL]
MIRKPRTRARAYGPDRTSVRTVTGGPSNKVRAAFPHGGVGDLTALRGHVGPDDQRGVGGVGGVAGIPQPADYGRSLDMRDLVAWNRNWARNRNRTTSASVRVCPAKATVREERTSAAIRGRAGRQRP